MSIIKTDSFEKEFANLPQEIRRLYHSQEIRFKENWRDSRLHLKKVKLLENAFSFRVTRRYRVFFYFQDSGTAVFFDVDHRKNSYRGL